MLGANVNLPNAHGNTPLHRAAKHGHVQIALALRHHGADVQLKNGRGETAAESSRTEALRDELLRGVEPAAMMSTPPVPGTDEPGARGANGLRAELQAQAQAERRRRDKTLAAKACLPRPPRALHPVPTAAATCAYRARKHPKARIHKDAPTGGLPAQLAGAA